MKYLILIDKKFPYKSGESFLENEIDEISKFFDKILIYPIDASFKDKITRNIKSKNVEPIVINNKSLKFRRNLAIFNSFSNLFKVGNNLSLKQKIIDGYFMSVSKYQTKKIIKNLDSIEFKKDDKIVIYSYWLYTTAMIACNIKDYFAKKNIKVKVVSRAHRFDIYVENNRYKFLPRREELLSKLDTIYACSENGENYLKEKYFQFSKKIKTGYLGTYDHGIGKKSTDGIFRIVSCSRMIDIKRVDLIVKALELLENENLKLEWTHIGDGPEFDKIKQLSKDIDWMKVNLLGYVKNTEVYDYYMKNPIDLFINVSSSEGLPVSIMEAISFGIPVIATNVGGTSEIVKNNVSGKVIDKNFKTEVLAEKIKEIIKMPKEKYVNLRNDTRILWEDYFQAKLNYEKFAKSILNSIK